MGAKAYARGILDEVSLWGRALAAGEVAARYAAASSLRSNLGVALGARQDALYYYLGGRLVATRRVSDLAWVSQDHLAGTALVTDGGGNKIGEMKFYPFGGARSGSVPTDRRFTGQRLDGSGLYYYGARYYDPELGRFISADTLVPQPANPQAFNRYSYTLNNPLKYVDPSGHQVALPTEVPATVEDLKALEEAAAAAGVSVSFVISDKENKVYATYVPFEPAEPGPSRPTGPQAGVGPPTPTPPPIPTPIPNHDDDWLVLTFLDPAWPITGSVPALMGTATAYALFWAYPGLAAMGPPGWFAIGVIATTQTIVFFGGLYASYLINERHTIPTLTSPFRD